MNPNLPEGPGAAERCPHDPPLCLDGVGHRHSRPCPCCGGWTAPYDDLPWPEGQEWTSAHRCGRCDAVWTHGWQYPSGDPSPDAGV